MHPLPFAACRGVKFVFSAGSSDVRRDDGRYRLVRPSASAPRRGAWQYARVRSATAVRRRAGAIVTLIPSCWRALGAANANVLAAGRRRMIRVVGGANDAGSRGTAGCNYADSVEACQARTRLPLLRSRAWLMWSCEERERCEQSAAGSRLRTAPVCPDPCRRHPWCVCRCRGPSGRPCACREVDNLRPLLASSILHAADHEQWLCTRR